MEIINRFKDPERWSDYNLVCFFVQLTVILLASFLVFRFCVYGNPEISSYTKGGVVSSIFSSLKAEPGEEKLLRKIPSLNSDEEYVKTDKFIDIAHGGVWLTEKQDGMFGVLLFGICFGGVALVFIGAGPIYRLVRRVIAVITLAMCRYFIFIIPFGLWGAVVSLILAIAGYLTMLLFPFILLTHLILGIIQIRNLKKAH